MYHKSWPGALWGEEKKITAPELGSQMLPEIFLVPGYQTSDGGNEEFMCKAQGYIKKIHILLLLCHSHTLLPWACNSLFPYFKQEILHSILREYFKNFLLGAAFSSLQSQDQFPAEIPAQRLLHVMVWRMNSHFSEWEKGIFQADVYSKVFLIAFCWKRI